MKEVACISGRSSRGKDSLLAALAYLAEPAIIVDCSFEYGVLRRVLGENSRKSRKLPFFRGFSFDADRCSHCRQCLEICHQQAIGYVDDKIKYYEYRCSHCGSCIRWCPLMVMNLEVQSDISLVVAETQAGPLIFTESLLEPSLVPEMIRALREQGIALAKQLKSETIFINGSRGAHDASFLTLSGVDAVVIVVSPSPWAITDLETDVRLSRLSGTEPLVVGNLMGLDEAFDTQFENYCSKNSLKIAGRIPSDPRFRQAVLKGASILDYCPVCDSSEAIRGIWQNIRHQVKLVRS